MFPQGEHYEAGGVVVPVHKVGGQRRQAVFGGRLRGGEGGQGRVGGGGHQSHRPGRIVGGNRFPAPPFDAVLGLSQGLRVGGDAPDAVDVGSGQPDEGVAHLDEMFADDGHRVAGEAVQHRQHAPGGGIFDGEDQPLHRLVVEGVESVGEAGVSDVLPPGKQFPGGAGRIGAALALISDFHMGPGYPPR